MRFLTEDLPFAAYLYTTRTLTFIRCESPNGTGRVVFVFDDPRGDAEKLHIAFESGAECPAAAFYDSIRHLRRVMTRIQNTRTLNNGAIQNGSHV
jgi:hypothetical protein